jgi:deazaflavin-dependent oxidoreductase (nitroreductase family)
MCGRLVGWLVRSIVRAIVVAAVAGAVLGAVFVVGMRTKSPGVQRAVKRMNKAYWNPRSMETAGTPGAYASVVRHVGRRSATVYETPVVPVTTEDGVVIALPYGDGADWVQNVLASGSATLSHEGETFQVDRPEVVPMEQVDAYFADAERRTHRMMRVDQGLRLRRVDSASGSTSEAANAGWAGEVAAPQS